MSQSFYGGDFGASSPTRVGWQIYGVGLSPNTNYIFPITSFVVADGTSLPGGGKIPQVQTSLTIKTNQFGQIPKAAYFINIGDPGLSAIACRLDGPTSYTGDVLDFQTNSSYFPYFGSNSALAQYSGYDNYQYFVNIHAQILFYSPQGF